MKQRATALTSSQLLDQPCDLLIPRLEKPPATRVPTKKCVVGTNPSQLDGKMPRSSLDFTLVFLRHAVSGLAELSKTMQFAIVWADLPDYVDSRGTIKRYRRY